VKLLTPFKRKYKRKYLRKLFKRILEIIKVSKKYIYIELKKFNGNFYYENFLRNREKNIYKKQRKLIYLLTTKENPK
jgi:hypothetical protein